MAVLSHTEEQLERVRVLSIEGHSIGRIATELGLTAATVNSMRAKLRARRKLARMKVGRPMTTPILPDGYVTESDKPLVCVDKHGVDPLLERLRLAYCG